MSDDLLRAWAEFKRLLIEDRGREAGADLLDFAAAMMRAEARAERGNVIPFKKGDAA